MPIKNIIQLNRWRDAIRRRKARLAINTFWNQVNKSLETPIPIHHQQRIQRMLIEYIGSARSINEIENTLAQQGIPLSRYHIDCLMLKTGALADIILEYFDELVVPMIHVVEADETFHGEKTMFFEAIDHRTGYLLALKLIPDAKTETLIPHYEDLLQRFPEISTFITDLAPAYPKAIGHLRETNNKELGHVKCQVHALRTLYKEIDPMKRKYKEICTTIRSLKEKRNALQTKLRKTKKSKSYHQTQYQRALVERDRLQRLYKGKNNRKNCWKNYPNLKELNIKINKIRSTIRGKTNTITLTDSKLLSSRRDLAVAEKEKPKRWNYYMNHLKMITYFVSYCKHRISTLQEFSKKIRGFKHKSCREFKTKAIRFVQSHPELMTLHQYLDEGESFSPLISTNKIESFNGVFKRYKDARRFWKDTVLTTSYLSILRLSMNLRIPLCSKGRGSSPVEKFGIVLKGTSLYDLLFIRTGVSCFGVAAADFEIGLSVGGSLLIRS